jgi:molybdopterin converting factor small subunit
MAKSNDTLKKTVSLRLYGHLLRYGKSEGGFEEATLESFEKIEDLVRRFKIPLAEIGMVLVNEKQVSNLDALLHNGDEIKLFGLVGGG